jgi:predicted RNase H-like nuclease (RuvC/YqgF family)
MTDQPPQQAASIEELQESIDELSAYRERLYNDVLGLGKKLRLSQKKIDAALSEHAELTRIDEVLDQLKAQIKFQSDQ